MDESKDLGTSQDGLIATEKVEKTAKLFHFAGARSSRVVWLLYEVLTTFKINRFKLGLETETEVVQVQFSDLKKDWYLKVNPNGKIPAYKEGDLDMWEAGKFY